MMSKCGFYFASANANTWNGNNYGPTQRICSEMNRFHSRKRIMQPIGGAEKTSRIQVESSTRYINRCASRMALEVSCQIRQSGNVEV